MKKVLAVLLVVMLLGMTVSTTVAQDDLGTPENPIQVYFVPSVEAQVLIDGGEVLAAALEEATGLSFDVAIPTSYAATIEEMCAAPDVSMGFIPSAGYVIASARCGVEVYAAAARDGRAFYTSAFITRRDSDIYVFGDLEGKTWGYGDAGSTSGYIVPSIDLAGADITIGDTVETGGHMQTVLAVYNGEVDFGTVYYSPPRLSGAQWGLGDLPEPYDLALDEPYIGDDGNLYVGDIEIMDARALARETVPDIIEQVRILRLTSPIPNDTMSFGSEFPDELKAQIFEALVAFSKTEAWEETALGSDDGYSWDALTRADDSLYDGVRLKFEILGLTEEDIFE